MTNVLHDPLIKKTIKYQPLINYIATRDCNVATFMVLVACARAITHIPSMKSLDIKLFTKIKNTYKRFNTIATQYAHSILVHKQN